MDLTLRRWRRSTSPNVLLVGLLIVHVWMMIRFLSPEVVFSTQPIFSVDHAVHTHRVHMYREALFESWVPWGYDPSVSAGLAVSPSDDVGAKPQQVLGVILWWMSPAGVIKLFLLATLFLIPVSPFLAARSIGVPEREGVWIVAAMMAMLWLHQTVLFYLKWGLVAFVAASAVAPWVLSRFLRFVDKPSWRRYASLVGWSSVLQLLHGEGPWIVAPVAALIVFAAKDCRISWRVAGLLTPLPVAILNAFWLVPYFLAMSMPRRPQNRLPDHMGVSHLTYSSWAEVAEIIEPAWLGSRLAVVAALALGYWLLARLTSRLVGVSLFLAASWCLFLKYFGSFVPILGDYQTVRFIVPAIVLVSIPLGLLMSRLESLASAQRIPAAWLMVAGLILVLGLKAPAVEFGRSASLNSLISFATEHTTVNDRLAIQSSDGHLTHGYEARALGEHLDREVLGSAYPGVHDSAQFLRHFLLGSRLEDWDSQELRKALERWGISWVFTKTSESAALLRSVTGKEGVQVPPYLAFHVSKPPDRFLVGDGTVQTEVNRMVFGDLQSENGLIVVRYRYHPAWEAIPPTKIRQYLLPEDPKGFLALEDPPEELVLKFRPWKMLFAPWPSGPDDGQIVVR